MASAASKEDDPMYIYKVHETPCDLLTVTVNGGVIKGAGNDSETYVELAVLTSPEPEQKQKTSKSKNPNPEWNEAFKFHMDPKKKNILDIFLYIGDSQQKESIALNANPDPEKTLTFKDQTEIHLQLTMKHNVAPDLRFGISLNKEEDEFLKKRKEKVMAKMKDALGKDGPNKVDEVPVVGVLGSGGGFRAMIAFSGVLSALYENGLLDMTCYMAGLSGSAWFLGYLNSHSSWPFKDKQDLEALQTDLTNAMTMDKISAILHDDWIDKTGKVLQEAKSHGQETHFIDYYGYALAEILLKGREDCGLSGLQHKVAEADVPLPLYSCINVREKEEAKSWHEWMEFSPYEVGLPKYGVFMTPQQFGNHFFLGRRCTDYPEELLHYFMGIWGSAFNINMEDLEHMHSAPAVVGGLPTSINLATNDLITPRESALAQPKEEDIPFWKKLFTFVKSAVTGVLHFFFGERASPGVIKNFLSDLSYHKKSIENHNHSEDEQFKNIFEPQSRDKPILLADGGLAFNLPFPLLLRQKRRVDIILSFDFSEMTPDNPFSFQQLILAELWAKKHGIPFPEIDENIIKDKDPKEFYIFKDKDNPECPVIIHFILANISFKNLPGSKEEKEFRNFELWNGDYETLKVTYKEKEVDRLRALMKYNTNLSIRSVEGEIRERVMMKRNPRVGPMKDAFGKIVNFFRGLGKD